MGSRCFFFPSLSHSGFRFLFWCSVWMQYRSALNDLEWCAGHLKKRVKGKERTSEWNMVNTKCSALMRASHPVFAKTFTVFLIHSFTRMHTLLCTILHFLSQFLSILVTAVFVFLCTPISLWGALVLCSVSCPGTLWHAKGPGDFAPNPLYGKAKCQCFFILMCWLKSMTLSLHQI